MHKVTHLGLRVSMVAHAGRGIEYRELAVSQSGKTAGDNLTYLKQVNKLGLMSVDII